MKQSEKGKWAEVQLTYEQAVNFSRSKVWKDWTPDQIVRLQLFQQRMCVDSEHFHRCLQDVLGREVFTHEFAYRDDLVLEYLGEKEPPTFDEIVLLIPEEKRLVIGL